jgi:hypothetical protein
VFRRGCNRRKIVRTFTFGAAFLLGGTFLSSAASAQAVMPMCTSVGVDTACGAIINVAPTGGTVKQTGMGPYDGSDDTLIGVANMIPACSAGAGPPPSPCGVSIYSLDLTSSTNIFAFEGDGISSPTYGAPGNAMDTTGYGGPHAYFTNISTDKMKGRVNFMPPIPPGGTDYFSLENALNGTACANLINNTLQTQTSKGNICATFTPNQNLTIKQAAAACGFKDFDWTQQITKKFDPSAAFARNTNGVFDPRINGPVRLSSQRVPWSDPPQGGGYLKINGDGSVQTSIPDNSYPFYYDQNTELAGHENGTKPVACTLTVSGNSLTFHDAPADPCLPGGFLAGNPPTVPCTDAALAPGATGEPAGSFTAYQTHLAGVNSDGTATDLGIGFTWKSDYDGTTGGATIIPKTDLPADGNGTGGVTITSVNQTSTYTGIGVAAINGSNNALTPTSLLGAVLPESRSAQPKGTVTAFATIINTGANTATSCSISPAISVPANLVYQTTNSSTNALTGTANTPVDIAGNNGSQSFVIAFTPTAAIPPINVAFNFSCTNTTPAPIVNGLNTLLLSASTTSPTPDVIALGATVQNDGIVHVTGSPSTGVFAVASDNLGSSDMIKVATNTGAATLPVTITLCQTNPTTGVCLQTPMPTVTTTIATNATPTFGIFVSASGTVPFDPANNRIFVTFTDSTNAVRGETSVAVETQ